MDEDEAEGRSGALYANMFVVESNWTGPEIFPRLIVPDENLTCPSRYGMGAETSGRLLRLVVNALEIVDMVIE